MRITVLDSTGQEVDIGSCHLSYTYNGPNGANDTVTETDITGRSWVATSTFDGSGNLLGKSRWIPQQ